MQNVPLNYHAKSVSVALLFATQEDYLKTDLMCFLLLYVINHTTVLAVLSQALLSTIPL